MANGRMTTIANYDDHLNRALILNINFIPL